jgi:serine/threonine protein phosphatase PrpC
VVQVGDSRAYIYTHGMLHQITRDQTLAQELVDEGAMRAEDLHRSPLSNVLSSASVAERGCTLVFCTDGLTRHVSHTEIAAACAGISSSERTARDLLQMALDRGGLDNITIIVARAPLNR